MTINKLRVWLDDVRPMPSSFDLHCRTAEEVIELIKIKFVLSHLIMI